MKDKDVEALVDNGNRLVSRRMLDFLFIVQIVLNILVLALVVGLLYSQTAKISEISTRQNEGIQIQNDVQICGLHDMLVGLKRQMRALGLPGEEEIVPPNVDDIDCEVLLRTGGE